MSGLGDEWVEYVMRGGSRDTVHVYVGGVMSGG
jgi:hypothetical protein